MAHRIQIELTSLGERGPRYRVRHTGAVLIEGTRNPELDACRSLQVVGVVGRLQQMKRRQ